MLHMNSGICVAYGAVRQGICGVVITTMVNSTNCCTLCWSATPGTNRALLCKSSSDGQNQVLQIGRPHSTDNEEELQRLAALGEADNAVIYKKILLYILYIHT